MKILITGINSFVGESLSKRLLTSGHLVSGTARNEYAHSHIPTHQWSLEGNPHPDWFSKVDLIIHLAWDTRQGKGANNLKGTVNFFRAAKAAGVKRQIFVSSCSSHSRALSEYGTYKFKCEKALAGDGVCVVRPGLVIGYGGGFRQMMNIIKFGRVVPLINSGRQRVPVIGLDDLSNYLLKIAESDKLTQEYDIYYANAPSLKDFLSAIARFLNKKIFFISVPAKLISLALIIFERLRIPSPLSREQFLGYMGNESNSINPSFLDDVILGTQIDDVLKHELGTHISGGR